VMLAHAGESFRTFANESLKTRPAAGRGGFGRSGT